MTSLPNVSRMESVICLFRNDLRYHDNECLWWAHRYSDHIIPLYCFDPRHFGRTNSFGFEKTGPFRAKVLVESVQDLRQTLRKHGSDLVVRNQKPERAVKELMASANVSAVVLQKGVTSEELKVEKAIKRECGESVKFLALWGLTLYHIDDIQFSIRENLDSYTQFQKAVKTQAKVRSPFAMPDRLKALPEGLTDLGEIPSMANLSVSESRSEAPTNAFSFSGGESAALQRLHAYLRDLGTYKKMCNGRLGENYLSKLSPWLALGCLSPKTIIHELRNSLRKYQNDRVVNQIINWVSLKFLWRDYYKFIGVKFGNDLFRLEGIMDKTLPWKQDKSLVEAWREGKTGVPFVDANMRELRATGWMSHQGREIVASYLVKNLGVDWRAGAEWFESMLLDHDVCSNYGNWNNVAGIGNEPCDNQEFNIVKQGLDNDLNGEYIRTWIPELKGIAMPGISCSAISAAPSDVIQAAMAATPGNIQLPGASLAKPAATPVKGKFVSEHEEKVESSSSGSGSYLLVESKEHISFLEDEILRLKDINEKKQNENTLLKQQLQARNSEQMNAWSKLVAENKYLNTKIAAAEKKLISSSDKNRRSARPYARSSGGGGTGLRQQQQQHMRGPAPVPSPALNIQLICKF